MRKCALCQKKSMPGNGTFFNVPKDMERRKKWSEICKKDLTPSARICIDHFSLSDMAACGTKKMLLAKALPIVDNVVPKTSFIR